MASSTPRWSDILKLFSFIFILCFSHSCAARKSILSESLSSELNDNTRIELNPSEIRDGGIVEIKVVSDLSPDKVTGQLLGKDLVFFKLKSSPETLLTEWVTYVGIPYEKNPGEFNVEVKVNIGGEIVQKYAKLKVKAHPYPSEKLSVEPGKVFLSKKDKIRAEKERRMMREIYSRSAPEKLWIQKFKKPLNTVQTSIFGTKRMFNGKRKGQHLGADFRAGLGRKIRVANRGRVVFAGNLFYAGNTVVVDHGIGVFTLYAHLSKVNVKAGQMIVRHSLIGRAGATGRVTGPHLHWAARVSDEKVDPLELLNF